MLQKYSINTIIVAQKETKERGIGMKIRLGNGNEIECRMVDGVYVSEREVTEGMFEGMKNIEIETEDGFKKTIKRGRLERLWEREGVWKFSLRELSKEEIQEESRKRTSRRQNKWISENYERVSMTLPKGTKERIGKLGYSVNGFINEAVKVMLDAQEQG